MKRFAFTLAEALIALTVVGVVATTVLPTLSSNVQRNAAGPALAKAINTIEHANSLALQKWGARTLDEAIKAVGAPHTEASYFDVALQPVLKAEKLGSARPSYVDYKKFDLSGSYSGANSGNGWYQGVDDICYVRSQDGKPNLNSLSAAQIANLPPAYSGKYYTLYIDTNGFKKKPNAIGKDLFLLWVDSKGCVIPYGGEAHRDYIGGEEVLWKTKCNEEEVTDPETCAGSIADNKYKVIHKY